MDSISCAVSCFCVIDARKKCLLRQQRYYGNLSVLMVYYPWVDFPKLDAVYHKLQENCHLFDMYIIVGTIAQENNKYYNRYF